MIIYFLISVSLFSLLDQAHLLFFIISIFSTDFIQPAFIIRAATIFNRNHIILLKLLGCSSTIIICIFPFRYLKPTSTKLSPITIGRKKCIQFFLAHCRKLTVQFIIIPKLCINICLDFFILRLMDFHIKAFHIFI